MELVVRVRWLAIALAGLALGTVAASTASHLLYMLSAHGYVIKAIPGTMVDNIAHLFSLEEEVNFPTLTSTLLLFIAAVITATIGLAESASKRAYARHWLVISVLVLIMSFDETISLHESLIMPMRKFLAWSNLGFIYYAWVVPGIAVSAITAVIFTRFMIHLERRVRVRLAVATALYLGGALGLEMIGGRYAEAHGVDNLIYFLLFTMEESLEMAGIIVLIWALLLHVADNYGIIIIRFTGGEAA